jgi:hypothetical protein
MRDEPGRKAPRRWGCPQSEPPMIVDLQLVFSRPVLPRSFTASKRAPEKKPRYSAGVPGLGDVVALGRGGTALVRTVSCGA